MAKKKRYKNGSNNPKKDIMEKKIPFNASVRRKVVLEFKNVCKDLGLCSHSPLTEELLLEFINNVRQSQRENK